MTRICLLLFLLVGLSGQTRSLAQDLARHAPAAVNSDKPQMTEEDKIGYLINYIRHLQGSTFIRNGEEFNPDKAADHLQNKYNKHKKKVKTAHDFVTKLATFSRTKEPYQIRLVDGETVPCGDLLNKELKRLESGV